MLHVPHQTPTEGHGVLGWHAHVDCSLIERYSCICIIEVAQLLSCWQADARRLAHSWHELHDQRQCLSSRLSALISRLCAAEDTLQCEWNRGQPPGRAHITSGPDPGVYGTCVLVSLTQMRRMAAAGALQSGAADDARHMTAPAPEAAR